MTSSHVRKIRKNLVFLIVYYFSALISLLVILAKHPRRIIYLYQWEGMGDLSIALSYVPAHMELNKRKGFFCLYKKHNRYIRFFSFIGKNVKYYNFQRLDNMCVVALRFFRRSKRVIVLNPNNYSDLGIYEYQEISSYGWGEFTRDYILNIPKNFYSAIYYPKETSGACEINIEPNAVLINLTSNTAPSLDEFHLFKICESLSKKGYSVYINQQQSFGYKSFYFPLNEMLKNSHKFSYIISVRSGLLDLLSGKNANIIAINTTDENNYSLRYNMSYWRNGGISISICNIDKILSMVSAAC